MGKKGANSGPRNNGQSNGVDDEFATGSNVQKRTSKDRPKKNKDDFWGDSTNYQEEQAFDKIKSRVWKLLLLGFFIDHKKLFGAKNNDEEKKAPRSGKKEAEKESLVDAVKRHIEWAQANMTMILCVGFVILLFSMKAAEEGWRPGVHGEESINPYDALGVSRGAPQGEIRKAYKKLAMEWHPDKHDPDCQKCQDRFAEISIANDKIGTPDARKAYDANRSKKKDLNLGSSVQLTDKKYEEQVVRGTDVWAVIVLDSHNDSGDSVNALWSELSDTHDSKFTKFGHIDVGSPDGQALASKLGIKTMILPLITRLCSGTMNGFCNHESKLIGGRDRDQGTKQIRRFIYDAFPRTHLPYVSDASSVNSFLTSKSSSAQRVVLAAPYASVIPSNTYLNQPAETTGFKTKLPSKVKEADTLLPVQQILWLYKAAYEYANLGIEFRITDFDTALEAANNLGDEKLKEKVEFYTTHQDSESGKSLQDLPYFVLSSPATKDAVKAEDVKVSFTAIPKREHAASGARGNGKIGLEVYGQFALAEMKNSDDDHALKIEDFSRKLRKAAKVADNDSFLELGEDKNAGLACWQIHLSELAHAVHNAPEDMAAESTMAGSGGLQKGKLLQHVLHAKLQNLLLGDGNLKQLTQSNWSILCKQKPKVGIVKRQCLLVNEHSNYFSNGWDLVADLKTSRKTWLKENAEAVLSSGKEEEKESAVSVMPVKILGSDAVGFKKQYPVKSMFHSEVTNKWAAPDASFNSNLFITEFATDRVARVQNKVSEELVTSLTYDDVHMHDSEVPLAFMMANDQGSVASDLWNLAFGDWLSCFIFYVFLCVWLASFPEARNVSKIKSLCYFWYPVFLVLTIVASSYQLRKNVLSIVDFS